MQNKADAYLAQLNKNNRARHKMMQTVLAFSLIVVAGVFWCLKLTGITLAGEAFCGMEEHVHTEACMPEEKLLICELEETEGHTHTDVCLKKELLCEIPEQEGHVHTEECYERLLICEIISEEEIVSESGVNEETESGSESESDMEIELENAPENDADTETEPEAEHEHSEACYEIKLLCILEECEGHIHTETCYVTGTEYECGLEETEGHVHTEACYETTGGCMLEEHIHQESCYSNIEADVETSDDWEMTLANLIRREKDADNLIAVAESQLGYRESELNFQVDENGIRRGYTRYGEWYGNPYGDWATMFTSFCLEYAGISEIPANAGAQSMLLETSEAGLYRISPEYVPIPGDILFLDKNENEEADTTAIIKSVNETTIYVIEGDLENSVAETAYAIDDAAIIGYGVMPDADTEVSSNSIMTLDVSPSSAIASAVEYSEDLFTGAFDFVLYTRSGDQYYAIDGNANAVPVYIDESGNISCDVADVDSLLWTFTHCGTYNDQSSYYIQNISTGRYMHPYHEGDTSHGAILSGRWESALYPDSGGIKIRGARQNAYAYLENETTFSDLSDYDDASIFYLGRTVAKLSVWLDGTNGGLRGFGGSKNQRYSFEEGETFELPTEWQSPTKYSYRLQGWYDVTNSVYYQPGEAVTVTENMVFYADWIPATYDIGTYNQHTSNTVSSSKFITTRVFDYSYLFNVMSQNAEVTVSSAGHTENWSMVQSGNVDYKNAETLDYIFVDYSSGGTMSLPNNRNERNASNGVYEGLFNKELQEILFGTDNSFDPQTGEGIIGKTYLGEGDYLFQYASDPDHPYYGYYYYDSQLHAASYNQSAQRFYVYDYLSASSDSIGSNSYSDYLPFNSPYTNVGENNVGTYTYDGAYGEYDGTTHYSYSVGYSEDGNAMANLAFGTSMEVKFHLPGKPGETDEDGEYGNIDLYGKQMNFEFTGDDDLWVLVDGEMILDLGGIHGAESGAINFATGVVTVNGEEHHTITDMEAGEHVMQIYYLERGSSQSNCAMYFNLAPRYSLNIQKEDVLSQELLNGAEFSVYTDVLCTEAAMLWTDEDSYNNGELASNTFRVMDGTAEIWGFSSGNTYYIKETKPPDAEDYSLAHGIIKLTFDKEGLETYNMEIIPEVDAEGNVIAEISAGFMVHGVSVDEDSQKVYIKVTNAKDWVTETTTVQVIKKWEDTKDHSGDSVEAYLTVTDLDGTKRRIREIELNEENRWMYLWTGLPKYGEDLVTEIEYGVDESYESGYYSTSKEITKIEIETSTWAEAVSFVDNGVYLLKTSSGCLATESSTSSYFEWVDEESAKASPLALWTAAVVKDNYNNEKITFTNGAGQILTLRTTNGSCFYATTTSSSYQSLTATESGSGLKLYASISRWNGSTNYYIGSRNSTGTMQATSSSSRGLVFTPMTLITETDVQEIENLGFQITNTPLEKETSVTVYKNWETDSEDTSKYQEYQITVSLYANGVNTGRAVTLNLKNGWENIFQGLPYEDESGNTIQYTVKEEWMNKDWKVSYGEVIATDGSPSTYSTTITNTYLPSGPMLPSTGSMAQIIFTMCGGGIMLATLGIGIRLRRRKGGKI